MSVQMPTREQLRAVARQCGLSLDDASVDSFRALFTTYIEAYNLVGAMPDEVPRVKYPRTPGYRPGPEENKYNAWYYKSSVKGAREGKLKGKTLVLKDNIMLAGVPMMCGAATLEGS
jgi:amidase